MPPPMSTDDHADVALVGGGAAGLMAAITAGRANPDRRILILDGARRLGAKILVSGGGRCNVTHDVVDETAFAGSSRHAIRNVLRRFDVPQVIDFFAQLGVLLKREETGKLFPVTDSAGTILDALLRAAADAHVEIRTGCRVDSVQRDDVGRYHLAGPWGSLCANTLILATGGRSLPKSGSDGSGYALARSLGHTLTQRIFPALVPLLLPREHFLCALSGLAVIAHLEVRAASGKRLHTFTDSILCTHFGLSGPGILDISRYLLDAQADDSAAHLVINWIPHIADPEAHFRNPARNASVGSLLRQWLPERLARALCEHARLQWTAPLAHLFREGRSALLATLTEMRTPVIGDRGYTYAEVTAGGVPLSEVILKTMESRRSPRLHLCGEILDVDGRIGGYNFQWAWASGYVAGVSV